MRLSRAIRATAWGVVAVGLAAPLVRKRVNTPAIVAQTMAYAAPIGLCVAVRRSRQRDLAVCALQMWAYLAAYKSPHDDPHAQERRVRVAYPILIDRALGLGELPTLRLQRALARPPWEETPWRALDRVLVWAHWSWFMVPHGSLLYILGRRPERFTRGAVMTYAVFNLGASVYWVLPTAPPWWAASARARASEGHVGAPASEAEAGEIEQRRALPDDAREIEQAAALRRMMVEYGEHFWGDGWGSLYSVFGGNPLAAMPSLHFATSLMAAHLLAEAGPIAGVLGFSYAATLGFALVYLGEHYVVDLLAGAALTYGVRRWGPRAGPAIARFGRGVAALEARAHETS